MIDWRSAKVMMTEDTQILAHARLISLDHDLYAAPGDPDDPGDGLEIAKHLAPLRPRCPVIIHSSNSDRARMMAGEFELEGWSYRTVSPFPADWIETHWAHVVRQILDGETSHESLRLA